MMVYIRDDTAEQLKTAATGDRRTPSQQVQHLLDSQYRINKMRNNVVGMKKVLNG